MNVLYGMFVAPQPAIGAYKYYPEGRRVVRFRVLLYPSYDTGPRQEEGDQGMQGSTFTFSDWFIFLDRIGIFFAGGGDGKSNSS